MIDGNQELDALQPLFFRQVYLVDKLVQMANQRFPDLPRARVGGDGHVFDDRVNDGVVMNCEHEFYF